MDEDANISIITVVVHVATGKVFSSAVITIPAANYESELHALQEAIPVMKSMEAEGVILPGDFVRNHCVVELRVL